MQRDDRLTPDIPPESDSSWYFSIEHWPIAFQVDSFQFERPRKGFIATTQLRCIETELTR